VAECAVGGASPWGLQAARLVSDGKGVFAVNSGARLLLRVLEAYDRELASLDAYDGDQGQRYTELEEGRAAVLHRLARHDDRVTDARRVPAFEPVAASPPA
jgi:hypothetical protein